MSPDIDSSRADEVALRNLLRPLGGKGRLILIVTIIAVVAAAVIAVGTYVGEAATRSVGIRFQARFQGAVDHKYPNGRLFSSRDIVDPVVTRWVFAENDLQRYCKVEAFMSAFAASEEAPEHFELSFVPASCGAIPDDIVLKVLPQMLQGWSDMPERGLASKPDITALTPALFALSDPATAPLFMRADAVRTSASRVLAGVLRVEQLPGADLARGRANTSFAEIHTTLEDLIQGRIGSLLARAVAEDSRSVPWVEQSLQKARARQQEAQQRAEGYRQALREYAGTVPALASKANQNSAGTAGVIDGSFLDRVVALSTADVAFRQQLTRSFLAADLEAAERNGDIDQYQRLLSVTRRGSSSQSSPETVAAGLASVTHDAQTLTASFDDVYDQFLRSPLSGGSMYEVESGPTASIVRRYGRRSLLLLILAAAFLTPLLVSGGIVIDAHVREFVRSMR